MRDIAIGSYGEIPDHPPHRSMAPRGSDVEADEPDMGYMINDRAEVWSDNVLDLYEEAVAASGPPPGTSRGATCASSIPISSTPCASWAPCCPRWR